VSSRHYVRIVCDVCGWPGELGESGHGPLRLHPSVSVARSAARQEGWTRRHIDMPSTGAKAIVPIDVCFPCTTEVKDMNSTELTELFNRR